MTQRGKHFRFGAPGTARPRMATDGAWRKGALLVLILLCALFMVFDLTAAEPCSFDSAAAVSYLSLNVSGFSVFIHWTSSSCR